MKWIKKIGEIKIYKVFGYNLFALGLFMLIFALSDFISWQLKKDNYTKEYVYNYNESMYYESNNDFINVTEVYDTYNEKINSIPDNMTAIMYCSKENIHECIYFDMNLIDLAKINPSWDIFASLFLIILGLFFFLDPKKDKLGVNKIYLSVSLIALIGVSFLGISLYKDIEYNKFKKEGNIATATIFSEVYEKSYSKDDTYKLVAYYYVNNKKYIFVSSYESGDLRHNYNTTFKIYYNKENPEEAIETVNPIKPINYIISIIIILISLVPVILNKRMHRVFSSQDNDIID